MQMHSVLAKSLSLEGPVLHEPEGLGFKGLGFKGLGFRALFFVPWPKTCSTPITLLWGPRYFPTLLRGPFEFGV